MTVCFTASHIYAFPASASHNIAKLRQDNLDMRHAGLEL